VAAAQADVARRLTAIRAEDERNAEMFEITALLCILAAVGLAWVVIRGHRGQTRLLLDLNDEFNRIFTLSADILAVVDEEGGLISLNPAWTQVTGLCSGFRTGICLFDVVHPDDLTAVRAAFASGTDAVDATPRQAESRLRKADGSEVRVAWRKVKLPEAGTFYAIGRDVTVERAREEQLRQSQKMEVVGQLTGGIAHDFNNLLTVIVGSLELMQRDLAGMDQKIARRITLEANRLVTGMSEILHRVLGEHIVLELLCSAGLWRVRADGHQLENAILNLAVNARDAMASGGYLTIETQNAFLDENYVANETEVRPGHYVMIAVTDTGTGMTPGVAAQVFEPFFTTKPVGHGTGLGLAQVYGFIKQSHGHVKIYSEPGEGTTVKLYLPRLQASPEAPEIIVPPEPARNGEGQDETILVVEDEPAVREFAAEVLREYGYKVILAENALEALPIIETEQRIDLLFTDAVLTGPMNGRQLAEAFSARRAPTPILFTTGYTRNAIIHNGLLEGIAFLGKPFSAHALARQVRKMLDEA
jgi:PAS domain S-box-containing protein